MIKEIPVERGGGTLSLGVFGSSSFRFGYSFTNIGTSEHYFGLGHTCVEGVCSSRNDWVELSLGDKLLDLVIHWIDSSDRHSLVWDFPLVLHFFLGVYCLPGDLITVQGILEHGAV